jgi:hypothetical protein
MEERLHDPRLIALPHPIRIDAVSGEPYDTALFENLGILDRLRPHFLDSGTPTETIINDLPWMRPITAAHLKILGHHNIGSFILTMNRARLRAHGDPILEVTPDLQTLLDQTDVENGLPVRFLHCLDHMIYLRLARGNPLRVPHKMSGLHECEGAYIATYQIPAHHPMLSRAGRVRLLELNPAKPARVIEIVIIGSPVGKADALDDASQDFMMLIQDEDEPLSQVLERHTAYYNTPSVYSHPGMAPLNPREVAMVQPVAKELAKILLYLSLPDAEQMPVLERTDLERKLRKFGKLTAPRRERLALAYDRTLIGPRVVTNIEAENAPSSIETARTVRPHWRRGHFRRIRSGEAFSDVRIGWIRPTLVGAADLVNIAKFRPVGEDVDTGQSD